MENTDDQPRPDMIFPFLTSHRTMLTFFDQAARAARIQAERNLGMMTAAGQIARSNNEAAVSVACTAISGFVSMAESSAQISRRFIENGVELSRSLFDANAMRGLAQTEGNVARSFYSSFNDQIARFGEALMRTSDGMMKPLRDSIATAAAETEETVEVMEEAAKMPPPSPDEQQPGKQPRPH